jgi:hypothetical protein
MEIEMSANKFLLKVKGQGFVISLQGEGDSGAAKASVSNAFGGLPVSVLNFEAGDPTDLDDRG